VHVQHGADIAIRPDGTVYVFYLAATGSPAYKITYNWLPPGGTWNGPATVDAHSDSPSIYSTKGDGSGDLKRSNSADDTDYFVSNAFPRVAVNPVSGNIYLVYADVPSAIHLRRFRQRLHRGLGAQSLRHRSAPHAAVDVLHEWSAVDQRRLHPGRLGHGRFSAH